MIRQPIQQYTSEDLIEELSSRYPLFFLVGWKSLPTPEATDYEESPIMMVGPPYLVSPLVCHGLERLEEIREERGVAGDTGDTEGDQGEGEE